uniref:Uncharacterized protein n=1 Tax=Fagus sylvatica TaxID=28930 RepID=A0A2N9J2B7_FAGSY
MTSQLGLIRMLMWHHGGMIRGTWHVLAACWRALDGCQHIQARGEHMKTREKEGRHSAGAWKHVKRKVVTPPACGKKGLLSDGTWKSVTALMMKISPGIDRSGDEGRHSAGAWKRVKRKVVTPPAHGKEGLLSDSAWKSVKALMMKISSGIDRSGDVLHRNGVRFSSLKAKKEVWQAMQFLTAIKRAEERKTCKRQESDRSGHRFGAGLGGSDAFVSRIIHVAFRRPLDLGTRGGFVALHLAGSGQLDAWCWATLRGLHPQDSRRTPVDDECVTFLFVEFHTDNLNGATGRVDRR